MSYNIGLDLDGVVYHYDRSSRYMLRKRIEDRGEPVPAGLYEPSDSWSSVEKLVPAEDWEWLYREGVQAGLFRYGHVVGGAIEGAQALNQLGDVFVVTSRPKLAVHDTLVWISTFLDKAPLAGIHILSHGQRKSEVRPEMNIYIDDGPHNIEDIVENTAKHVRAVVFNQPHNASWEGTGDPDLDKRWHRAEGWREAVQLVADAKDGRW